MNRELHAVSARIRECGEEYGFFERHHPAGIVELFALSGFVGVPHGRRFARNRAVGKELDARIANRAPQFIGTKVRHARRVFAALPHGIEVEVHRQTAAAGFAVKRQGLRVTPAHDHHVGRGENAVRQVMVFEL